MGENLSKSTAGAVGRDHILTSLHLALRIARYFDLPVEAVFSLEPFGPLDAAALTGKPAVEPERR